ncbi:unnamed protein product [Vitrella brassicaformis CCMP3155]|uniref:HMG box domain-containing protein n=2 Tax=Vitrella brassicaformis TaxID=1169539 RepID=A0A0G4ET14_VITBC|nr:unnamed protein product [Vitrella brassicaformis CCMP3155]|eukprot:CEM01030.1 unnamed protein product [Vitrella brassicaformis CCMP3155]
MESEAFEKVRNTLFEGGKAAVDLLITEIANRNYRGLHDFWVRRLLSPIEKPSRKRIRTEKAPSVSAGGVDELRGFCKAVEPFVSSYMAEKDKLVEGLQQQKHQYDGLMKEVTAVGPFLKPVSGDDPIRSVEVCGRIISTAESSLTEMGDIALANRFQLWPGAVEDVSEEHIRRLVDYCRRKRQAAAITDECLQGCVRVPLKMGNSSKQEFFNKTAAIDEYEKTPLGVRYEILTAGTGPKPQLSSHIHYDNVEWRNGFNTDSKMFNLPGCKRPVSALSSWSQEAFTSMRVGERRRLIVPPFVRKLSDNTTSYVELNLLDIITSRSLLLLLLPNRPLFRACRKDRCCLPRAPTSGAKVSRVNETNCVTTGRCSHPKAKGTTTAQRSARKVKNVNAPKRSRSAFIFFTMDRRDEVVSQNPDLRGRVTEVSKILGAEWKSMSARQKKPYETQAKRDKERYEREMKEYYK